MLLYPFRESNKNKSPHTKNLLFRAPFPDESKPVFSSKKIPIRLQCVSPHLLLNANNPVWIFTEKETRERWIEEMREKGERGRRTDRRFCVCVCVCLDRKEGVKLGQRNRVGYLYIVYIYKFDKEQL